MADTELTGLAATAAAVADQLYIASNVGVSAVSKKATLSQVVNLADHDQTTNFVSNEHIDHTAVNISAGAGLAGGGTIAATRALDVDITNATDKASPVVGDELLLADSQDSGNIKKSDVAAIANLADHDQTTNFVANEHINHTSVNIDSGAGLSGGGDISSTRTLAVDMTTVSATTSADSANLFLTSEGGAIKAMSLTNLAKSTYREPPTITQVAVDTTLDDTHWGGVVEMASAGALVLTVPKSAPGVDIGEHVDIVQTGAGQITITAVASGVTIQKPATFEAKTKQQWSRVGLYKQAAQVMILSGHLSAA